jgi:signal-transduction protein with cAMP-binding, CBS, and nucleotidyltransferase domain
MDAKVRDVMTPGPIGVDCQQSIGDAARAMRDWGVGAVLVVDGETLCGVVTARDLVVRGMAADHGIDTKVGPLSSGDVVSVDGGAQAEEAAQLMLAHDVRRLPVLEDGAVTGVIAMGDLILYQEMCATVSELSADVSRPAA